MILYSALKYKHLDTFKSDAQIGYGSRDLAFQEQDSAEKGWRDQHVMFFHIVSYSIKYQTKELTFFKYVHYGLSYGKGWLWNNTSFCIPTICTN